MLKQYFLDIMRKGCNGLYLCEVPTGIGKSYQAAHAMEEYVKEIREEYAKAMRQCARTITDGRKLIYRVAHLIETAVSPESILLLTFTNKAAAEMKERAGKMLKEKCGITACTYHSFCVKMLRFYASFAGISPNFSIISSPDEADIIDIAKTELNFQRLSNMPTGTVFASMLSTCVNKGISLEDLSNTCRKPQPTLVACG